MHKLRIFFEGRIQTTIGGKAVGVRQGAVFGPEQLNEFCCHLLRRGNLRESTDIYCGGWW